MAGRCHRIVYWIPGGIGGPEEGAETPVFLARSPEVAGVTGRCFDEKRETASSALSHDRRVQERLWTMAADLTGLAGPDQQS
jgi:hypothetical protein